MARKKKSTLPSVEILIILVMIFSLISMAVVRCNKTKLAYREEPQIVASNEETEASINSKKEQETTTPTASKEDITPPTTTTPPPAVVSRLYVTLDDLNLRTGPNLDSTILVKLKLFDEVFFMNEVTDFKQKISLGPEVAEEPWIKVRSRKGHIGWVYGAGVHYYKKKRIEEPSSIPPSPE